MIRFRWRWGRVALALIIYWLTSTVGAGLLVRTGYSSSEQGWIIILMLSFVSICMVTERGQWSTWKRLGFVPLAWLVHAVLTPLTLGLGILVYQSGRPELLDRAITFFASIPVVLWAMWRSRLFVAQQQHIESKSS